MKREEIIRMLEGFPYDREDYWIMTGAAMVLYGIREETSDIDMGCSSKLADIMEAEGYLYKVMDDGSRWFKIGKDIELFENWLDDSVVTVEGFPVISIQGLIRTKQSMKREKDARDLALIKEYLEGRKK